MGKTITSNQIKTTSGEIQTLLENSSSLQGVLSGVCIFLRDNNEVDMDKLRDVLRSCEITSEALNRRLIEIIFRERESEEDT